MGCIELAWLLIARLHASGEQGVARLRTSGRAQSTVEYALVGALVVIAAAGALTLLGGEVTNVFGRISSTLAGAASASH